MADPLPQGQRVGPLYLLQPLHELLRCNRKNFPKFRGDHIVAFIVTCGVLGVEHEDISVRIFVEILQANVADWFYHLPAGSITNWNTMMTQFDKSFKPTEDVHALLDQFSQIQKESHEPMKEFLAKFNRMVNKIQQNTSSMDQIKKCFSLNAQLPEVSYVLRRTNLSTLDVDKRFVVSVEDDLIMSRKLRRESYKSKASPSSTSSPRANADQLLYKLSNDLISLKKQLAQHAPYQDFPRNNFHPRNWFPSPQTRLVIEGPPIKVPINATCEVLEPDDEEENEICEEHEEEADEELEELSGSHVHFLTTEGVNEEDDYEERVTKRNNESYVVMTHEKAKKKEKVVQPTKISKEPPTTIPIIARRGSPIPTSSTPKVGSIVPSSVFSPKNSFPLNDRVDKSKFSSTPINDAPSTSCSFDIIDHLKKTKIQISKVEFYQTHPKAFAKMVDFINFKSKPSSPSSKGIFPTPSPSS